MKRLHPLLLSVLLLALFAVPVRAQNVNFGLSSALGDNEVLVGQPQNQTTPGAVFVYQRGLDGDTWHEQAKLTASNGTGADGFGGAIDADGHTILIGAPGSGGAYVFQRDAASGGWTEAARLDGGDGAGDANFGNAVALHGDVALVGAPLHREEAGALHVFHRDPDTGAWTETALLVGSDTQAGDRFGGAVAMAGDRLFVGAARHNDKAGAVYIFRYNATTEAWDEEAKLVGDDDVKSFGASILVRDGRALVGAPGVMPGPESGGPPVPGAAYVFQFDDASATWTRQARLQPDQNTPMNLFGLSLAFAGDHALIGAPGVSQFSGAAYLFERDAETGAWQQAGALSPEKQGLLIFGVSVASTDRVAVVGVPGDAFGEGTASIFERNAATGAWTARASLSVKASGLAPIVGREVSCSNGTAAAFGCKDVDLVSFLPVQAIGGGRGVKLNDIWGWTDPQTGKEYALVGRMDGTSFVDVSDPLNPVFVGDLPRTEGAPPTAWRDIKVYKDHAFIVSDNAGAHGMQVFDLTRLRGVENPPVTFQETARYDRIHSAHNIVINEDTGFAYAVGSSAGGETCGGGLHMIDIREPANPVFAGCFADTETGRNRTGYTHDAQCVVYNGPDAEHRGREICFGANETALSIADVTDKDNTVALSRASYPNVSYSHQGWLTEDHRYFYMNDELDEINGKVEGTRTLVWDVTDLDDPQLIREYISENKASDHNLYIKGTLMYQSNYASGLRIFDISNIENPVEVGYFDTVPGGEDAPGFSGSWSNYPYFKSGVIAVTSMGEGLFVLKKREIDI